MYPPYWRRSVTDVAVGRMVVKHPGSPTGGRRSFEDPSFDGVHTILGIQLNRYSLRWQFFICSGGVMLFYMIYGYVQASDFSRITAEGCKDARK